MSWQNAAVKIGLRVQLKRLLHGKADLGKVRAKTAQPVFEPRFPPGWHVRPSAPPYGPGEWVERTDGFDPKTGRTVLYLHGGGYMFCTPHTTRPIAAGLALGADARVFSPDYRLAPEHRFPAPIDDALAAWRQMRAEGAPPERMIIAGDSAGGGLALCVLLKLKQLGEPMPAGAILFAPWTDLAATGASLKTNARSDPSLVGSSVGRGIEHYLGDVPRTDPLASPLYGDLRGLPPIFLTASKIEVLLDDSVRFAEKARAAGVEVDFRLADAVPHVWQNFAPFMPEARVSLAEAAGFIRERVG